VHCLKGHEHKITAIVVVDNDSHSLCISGDSGSGIFVWRVDSTLKEEPLNKWYEHNDWLYRGVNCLAVSGTGYLYTGSRDKTIKAWSLEVLMFASLMLCTRMCFHMNALFTLDH
jgi:WD40 repeat protein